MATRSPIANRLKYLFGRAALLKFAEVDISKSNKKSRIIAYGFDVLGFQLPGTAVSVGDNAEIEYLPFQSNNALDDADGAIILQGIFESLKLENSSLGRHTEVGVSKGRLQARETQVYNMLQEGKWVCLLVGVGVGPEY